MIVLDGLTFAKLAFKRLEHVTNQVPVLVAADGFDDLSFANANMRDHGDLAIITSQVG
jgi:hypothetical protein